MKVTINSISGLSGKPASVFAREAKRFSSRITVLFDGRGANGKSLSSLSSLGAGNGDEVEITAEGEDAEEALLLLSKLAEDGLEDR